MSSNTSSSDSSAQRSLEKPPTVNELSLMLVVWLGFGAATCFAIVRGWIRLKYTGRFTLDDLLAVFALLLLLASAIMYTVVLHPMYAVSRVSAGITPVPTGEAMLVFVRQSNLYLRMQFAITLAFWTCLWCVKASFLAFFYPLSNGLPWDRRLWWVVAGFVSLAYVACAISYPISCSTFTIGACSSQRNIQLSLVSLRMSTILDILTDLFIMIIPWKLLWVVKLSRKEKLGIGSIVGLGIVIVTFAVIRIIVTNTTGTHPEIVWLAIWSAVETTVAVIVICLTSFKIFLAKKSGLMEGYNSESYGRGNPRSGKDSTLRGAIPLQENPRNDEFRSYNGEVRKGSGVTNDSEEILVR